MHAERLKEVAKADRLVQDFLRSARSVGNPGVKHDSYEEEVGLFFRKRIPKDVGYWLGDGDLWVKVNGFWRYGWVLTDNYNLTDPTGTEIGRNPEGLYYANAGPNDIASETSALQRDRWRAHAETRHSYTELTTYATRASVRPSEALVA